MKSERALSLALLLASAALGACQAGYPRPGVEAAGSHYQILFTSGWLFLKQDAPGAQEVAFNDSAWRVLDLPHDWSIEGPFDQTLASGTGFLPGGIAWYRKHFTLAPADQKKVVTVRFDGIYKNSTVYLNGHKLGDRPYGYSSFQYDLTPYLNRTGDNVLAVRVDHHDFADSRWYPGSGIYRNVYLTATAPVHMDRYGVFVTTPQVTTSSASIVFQTTLKNDKATDFGPNQVVTHLFDSRQREVASVTTANITVPGKGEQVIRQQIVLPAPELWSIDHPTMYTAVTDLICPKGCHFDTYTTPFGIRTSRFDANTGYWLNDQNLKLKGVCLHEDAGGLGSVVPQQVWERRLEILKAAGVNAIRSSHNPPAPEFLDLCDRMGFVVMDEAFDEWGDASGGGGKKKWIDTWAGSKFATDGYHSDFAKWADTDLKDMVLRDRNHPSVIMWSIGNEIDYENDPYPHNSTVLAEIAPRLIADVKSVDTTRPVTAACAFVRYNTWASLLDVIGYNYQESYYDADHARMPGKVIYGSENGMGLDAWLAVANKPFISAQFLWTGIDYNGEAGRPRPATTAWPERSRPDGLIDLAGFPKPAYWLRKSLWNDAPMVKLDARLPAERADRTIYTPEGVACYTNCDALIAYQNGASLGQAPVPASHIVLLTGTGSPFNADLARGPVRVVGLKNGKPAAEDTFTLSGPPSQIALAAYQSRLGPGDGPNVEQIELSLLDAQGTIARDAGNDITVKVTGPGRLLAMESGDTTSHENYQDDHQKALHGRLLLYVETHGPVTVHASTPGVTDAQIKVGK